MSDDTRRTSLRCQQPAETFMIDDGRCGGLAVAFDLRLSGWMPVCERHAGESSIQIVTDVARRTALDDAADAYSEVAAGAVALQEVKAGLWAALRTLAASASERPEEDTAERHARHARTCDCLGHAPICCDRTCGCKDQPIPSARDDDD